MIIEEELQEHTLEDSKEEALGNFHVEPKREVGRPTVMTDSVISKLEEAFSIGASDREATFVAGISMATLYKYCQDNPEFSERKENLKDMLKYKARANISHAIGTEGNITLSQWYLERKGKDEFSGRTETTGKDGSPLLTVSSGSIDIEAIAKKVEDELKLKKIDQLGITDKGKTGGV